MLFRSEAVSLFQNGSAIDNPKKEYGNMVRVATIEELNIKVPPIYTALLPLCGFCPYPPTRCNKYCILSRKVEAGNLNEPNPS